MTAYHSCFFFNLNFCYSNIKELTFLFVKVTVDIPLDFCVVSVPDPWELFTRDAWTGLVVECPEKNIQ